MGINLDTQFLCAYISLVGFAIQELPLTDLCVSLGGNRSSKSFWDPVVKRVAKK